MILVFLLYALFASVFTAAKTGLMHGEPLFFLGTRMFLAGILLLGYEAFKKGTISVKKEEVFPLFKLALFNIYLTNAFEFFGLQRIASSKVCFIYSLSPFIAALFSYFFYKERLSLRKWKGLSLGFIGFLPLLMTEGGPHEWLGFNFSLGEAAVVLAVIFSVYGWILLKDLVQTRNMSSYKANGFAMLFGGFFALTHSFFQEKWEPLPVSYWPSFLESALFLIVVSNLIAYNLYGYLLKKYTATFLSFAGLMTPLFAAFFGFVFLNETISFSFYVSTLLVSFGLFIFYREELQKIETIQEV